MIAENHTWKMVNFGLITMYYQNYFQGDSTVDNVVYQKLYLRYSNGSEYFQRLMREDLTTQRVYGNDGNGEYPMYDFSATVGQEVPVYGIAGSSTVTITDVTTEFIYGVDRKVLSFFEDGILHKWIEGIGSYHGPADPYISGVADYNPNFTCFYVGNELAYSNPTLEVICETTLSQKEIEHKTSLQIGPVPTNDQLHVFAKGFDASRLIQVRIIDINGKTVFSNRYNSLSALDINTSHLASGHYILSITEENGPAVQQKFIIE
jgi:hypothetical protein